MRTSVTILLLAALIILPSSQAQAREEGGGRWALDLRAGAGFPTEDLGEDALNTGFGLEAAARFWLYAHVHAYAGWGWFRFSTDAAGDETDWTVEDTGYVFGFQWIHDGGRVYPWIRVGGVFNHVELEDDDGDITADSDHTLGFEIGGGVTVPFSSNWALTPGVRYRSYSPELEAGGAETSGDLNYVIVDLGVSYDF